jgi:hypothetical protein
MNLESEIFMFSGSRVKLNSEPVIHNKKARNNKNNPNIIQHDWYWTLHRFVGKIEDSWMEQIYSVSPKNSLSDQINSESVLLRLRNSDCFDFNYEPLEGDNLNIIHESFEKVNNRKFHGIDYLSFVYRGGEWTKDFYDPEQDELKFIKTGNIYWKKIKNQEEI